MTLKELRESGQIILEVVSGSHAYGTSTPASDLDIRGIFRPARAEHVSLFEPPQEIGDTAQDIKFYSLKKFMVLAMQCNPNIIEMLFPPDDTVRELTDAGKLLLSKRELFISTRAEVTFSGYAYAQIQKCRGQNKLINNPKSDKKPEREQFCYIALSSNCLKWVGKELSAAVFEIMSKAPMRPIPYTELPQTLLPRCKAAGLEHVSNAYRLYWYGDQECGGVFRDGNIVTASIPLEEEHDRYLGVLVYNQAAWDRALKDWHNYWDWVSTRNEARWSIQGAGKLDYDCYLESETEFLTSGGWRRYDAVGDELLATITPQHTLCFQKATDCYSGAYSGELFTYENRYTRFSVTPNHNLYVSDCHRGPSNSYSIAYNQATSNWHLETVADFFDARRSTKHIIASLGNSNPDEAVSDDFIKLVGLYLSEGSIAFSKTGKPAAIYISQTADGKADALIRSITEYDIRVTEASRKTRGGKVELTHRIQNGELASLFLSTFGHGCRGKKLPLGSFSFSTRQVLLLFDALIAGDGHKHVRGHTVYYSTSTRLISDLSLLLFCNGIANQQYIYDYPSASQLFIPKEQKQYVVINKHSATKAHWQRREVTNERIVCFTVPSGVLITRNKHKYAVMGNSKNLSHCFRLLYSGINLLETGEPIVRFEGEKLEFLRNTRLGKFSYEYLMEAAEKLMLSLKEAKAASKLPYSVNSKKIDALYRELLAL